MTTRERITKEVTTETGDIFTLYSFITGRDKRAIESVYLDETHIKQTTNTDTKKGEIEIGGATGSINHAMQDKAISLVVKEIKTVDGEVITGEKEKLNFILDLNETEHMFILAEIEKITEPKKAQATS